MTLTASPAGPGAGEAAARPGRGRLVAVDAARGLALIAMMATHIVPDVHPARSAATGAVQVPSLSALVAGGRASALFAVLAGVSLALSSGREQPPTGAALGSVRRGVLARALVVALVGLTLGLRPGSVAVILVDYGLLFAVAALLLGLRARPLAVLGAGWLLLAPVVSFAVRRHLPLPSFQVPSWRSLAHPLTLVRELLVTGYYPVLTWTGYLLVGMAVGRSALTRRRVAVALAAGGTAAALAATLASRWLVAAAGGATRLLHGVPAALPTGYLTSATVHPWPVRSVMYGTTPTTTWWWLAVDYPHSGAIADLLATTGSALGVLGVLLLVTTSGPRGGRSLPGGGTGRAGRVVEVSLAGAGSMTLTLYTAHVLLVPVMLTGPGQLHLADHPWLVWAVQAAAALTVGWAVRRAGLRGPLEAVAARASSAARAYGQVGERPRPRLPAR